MSKIQENNKALVRASFERWANGPGSPFELFASNSEWTIVGTSPLSKTYTRERFLDEVIRPFNARTAKPLSPTVHGIYADGELPLFLSFRQSRVLVKTVNVSREWLQPERH